MGVGEGGGGWARSTWSRSRRSCNHSYRRRSCLSRLSAHRLPTRPKRPKILIVRSRSLSSSTRPEKNLYLSLQPGRRPWKRTLCTTSQNEFAVFSRIIYNCLLNVYTSFHV